MLQVSGERPLHEFMHETRKDTPVLVGSAGMLMELLCQEVISIPFLLAPSGYPICVHSAL